MHKAHSYFFTKTGKNPENKIFLPSDQNNLVLEIWNEMWVRLYYFYRRMQCTCKFSLRQRLGFVLFTDMAASAKRKPSAEGAKNERVRATKVCRKFNLVPSETVAPSSYQWYNRYISSVTQTNLYSVFCLVLLSSDVEYNLMYLRAVSTDFNETWSQ